LATAARDGSRSALRFYRRLPDELRRGLRPLNALDEGASFLAPPARAAVSTATEMLRRLARLRRVRYRMRRLEGPEAGTGRALACVLALDDQPARYWIRTFFAEPPAEEPLGDVRALDVRDAVRRVAPLADIALFQLPWPLSRVAHAGPVVPSSVPFWLDTGRPLDAIVAGERSGRDSRKDDARRVRRLGLTVRLGRGAAEVERFRRELYEPYGARRFGDLFSNVPAHAFRHACRAGWLLFLEDHGRTVAGAVLERWGRDVRILAFGAEVDGPVPTGLLLEACYFHSIRFAVERRIPRLSLGTVRPVLSDGVLRYKRKWGGVVGSPSTWEAFLLRYRNTAATRGALAAAPLIVDRGRDGLAALVGAGAGELATRLPRIDTPGLAEIACLTETPVVSATPAGHAAVRIVPAPAVWPPEAAAASAAALPEAVPVRDLLEGAAAADPERASRPAHGH
jgi:hypothetical protein